MGEEGVEQSTVRDMEGVALDTEHGEGGVHHRQDLEIGFRIVDADDVEVALGELAESSFLRVLAPPHLVDMETFEGKGQFVQMGRHEAGEGHSQVETHGDLALAIVLEVEDLLVGFAAAFAEQHLGVFQHRRVDGHEAVGGEHLLKLRDDRLFPDLVLRHGVPETLEYAWFYDFSVWHGNALLLSF